MALRLLSGIEFQGGRRDTFPNSLDKGKAVQWRFQGGDWVGHAPQIFAYPPDIFLISISSSFG